MNGERLIVASASFDIQDVCCCSCQYSSDAFRTEESRNDQGASSQTNYANGEDAHIQASSSYGFQADEPPQKRQKTLRRGTEKASKLPKDRPQKWHPPNPPNFLSNTWLFLLISLMLLSIIPKVQSQKFTPDERRIIRGLFLKKFGLEKLVSETLPVDTPIPDYLWELYRQVDEEGPAEIVRHYYPVNAQKEAFLGMSGWMLMYNMSATNRESRKEALLKADLRVKLGEELHEDEDCGGRKINVYEVSGEEPKVFRLLDGRELKSKLMTRNRQWIDLDVSDALGKKRVDDDVVTLFIEYISSSPIELSNPQYSAALVTYFEEAQDDDQPEGNGRQKRSPQGNRNRQGNRKHKGQKHRNKHHLTPEAKNQCRRTNLYVDFSELQWRDWIVAPNGYDAYQCQGHCPHPLPANLNTTNHAIIQSLIHSLDPSIVPPPSCVPTEMSSVTILYRDINNAIMMKIYPDMVVDSCGCR